VEHVFGVIKRLWGFGKVRYRGLHKNATRAFTALALANIYLGRQRLMAQVRLRGEKSGRWPRKTSLQGCEMPSFNPISQKFVADRYYPRFTVT
jgi:hypothetical protein